MFFPEINDSKWVQILKTKHQDSEIQESEQIIEIVKCEPSEYIFNIVPKISQHEYIKYYDDDQQILNSISYSSLVPVLKDTFFTKCPIDEISLSISVDDYISYI